MTPDIEALLRQSGLSYTKQVDETGEAFMFPFGTAEGIVTVRLSIVGRCFWALSALRSLDGLGVQTSQRDLYLDLLRANWESLFAKASIWRDPDDEVDWIGVSAEVPLEGLTSQGVAWVVTEVGAFAEKVLGTIARHTAIRQAQRS